MSSGLIDRNSDKSEIGMVSTAESPLPPNAEDFSETNYLKGDEPAPGTVEAKERTELGDTGHVKKKQ